MKNLLFTLIILLSFNAVAQTVEAPCEKFPKAWRTFKADAAKYGYDTKDLMEMYLLDKIVYSEEMESFDAYVNEVIMKRVKERIMTGNRAVTMAQLHGAMLLKKKCEDQ